MRKDLSKITFRKFIDNNDFDDFQMKDVDYAFLIKVFGETSISKESYESAISSIDISKLRGKWELEFMVWFLEGLKKQIKKGNYNLAKKNNRFISFENEIMTSMERYAFTSKKLINYIKSNT